MGEKSCRASEYKSPGSVYTIQDIGDSFCWGDTFVISTPSVSLQSNIFQKTSEKCLFPDTMEGKETE